MPQGPPFYLLPGNKWLPIHHPPESWQIVSSPPQFDELGNRVAPQPPPGKDVYWWLQPKETWPYRDEMPFEPKVFGAWPSSKITMSDDLLGIWPGPKRVPPWGYIKIKVPGEPDTSFNTIPFTHMKIHVRYLSPNEMSVMTAITPMGPRYYWHNKNWNRYEYDYKEYRAALKATRQERIREMIAAEIYRTRGIPRPTKDLFE